MHTLPQNAMPQTIDDFHVPTPTIDGVTKEYAAIQAALDKAGTADARLAAVKSWDDFRRRLETWSALVDLRFNQDTGNEEFKRAREFRDEIAPKLTDLEVKLKRKLLSASYRSELEDKFGSQAFALWEADVMAFDPAIEEPLDHEAKLQAEYSELTAKAELMFRGEKHNLSSIVKYREDADRSVRHAAEKVRW